MPVERKVQASTAAAAVSGLALWALGRYAFKGSVPNVVASWVYAIIPALITLAAGYLARHTPRGQGEPAGNMPADIPAGMPAAARAEKTLLPPAAPE